MSAASSPSAVESLVLSLHAVGAIRLDGPFTLKSGLSSPFYVDLRLVPSCPDLLADVTALFDRLSSPLLYSLICGVPDTAVPFAALLAARQRKPLVMRRKEVKGHGRRRALEGKWRDSGERCLVVEDLVTSGLSVFETVGPLEAEGIEVEDIVVVMDREQGGRTNVERRGKKLHCLVTISEAVHVLLRHGRIDRDTADRVTDFVRQNPIHIDPNPNPLPLSLPPPRPAAHVSSTAFVPRQPFPPRLTYRQRQEQCPNAMSAQLFSLMEKKCSNLCLSADVEDVATLVHLADVAGPYLCMLKTHADCISDWSPSAARQLQEIANRHSFLLFEDRKFADIGATVLTQYRRGTHKISTWSHIINAHLISGPGVIDGLKSGSLDREPTQRSGLLLIAEMSSAGQLATGAYTSANVTTAESPEHADFIMGFICQQRLSSLPHLLHCTPGVSLKSTGDAFGQQYITPQQAVTNGADVLIIGRAITKAADVRQAAQEFQRAGWAAYEADCANLK